MEEMRRTSGAPMFDRRAAGAMRNSNRRSTDWIGRRFSRRVVSVSDWKIWKAVAAGILADRGPRRRALTGFAAALLAMFAVGLWGIDGWLAESIWRFAIYWLLCAGLALFVMLFALFDLLATLREERDR